MYKKSERIIESFFHKDDLDEFEQKKLIGLANSPSASIRERAAELMGMYYEDKYEDVLYRLTFDKDIIVRLEAIDSLASGSSKMTLQRLETLCRDKDESVRYFALLSHFDVFTSIYEGCKGHKENYIKWLDSFLLNEKDIRVIIATKKIAYQLCDDGAMAFIVNILADSIKDSVYGIQATALNLIEEIVDSNNVKAFAEAVMPYYGMMTDGVKERIDDICKMHCAE